ncbi:hypothetical protein ADK36_12390 [Streptomyces viridochromogenes]|nr:hypothetical protein ADK36_12390 [Streptomyces viridochromogenes]
MSGRPQGGADSRRSAAGPGPCERCGAPVLKQLVGHRAALNVTADAVPQPAEQLLPLTNPNRLLWCLVALHGGGSELRWRCRHDCGHDAVIEHRCPPGVAQYGRRPEGAMW